MMYLLYDDLDTAKQIDLNVKNKLKKGLNEDQSILQLYGGKHKA